MKVRFVHLALGETADAIPIRKITVPGLPAETEVMAWVEFVAADDELSRRDVPRQYTLALRVLDGDQNCIGEWSQPLRPAINSAVLPVVVPRFTVTREGEHTLEVTIGDAHASVPVAVVVA